MNTPVVIQTRLVIIGRDSDYSLRYPLDHRRG
jgi:hypothetical protein